MKADFLDAHERHWDDAESLFATGRFANADHLYGLAAECGLKRLMQAFGMPLDPTNVKPVETKDRAHADKIWARFESYRSGHSNGAAYVLPDRDPFFDWDISDRYAHQSNFDQQRAKGHQVGAAAVCELVKRAQREGLLP